MKVGDRPLDFTELDQHGKAITLSNCQRPLVLAFLVGRFPTRRDGNHYATKDQREFIAQLLKVKDAGFFVVIVSTEYFPFNAEVAKELNIDLPLLDDSSNYDIAMAYSEVPDLISMNRHYPIYLIDESFTIKYASEPEESWEEVANRLLAEFQIERVKEEPSDSKKLS